MTSGGGKASLRQRAVLQLLADGKSIKEIALEIFVSERTVKNDLYEYAKVNDLIGKTHAVAHALREGVIE